MKEMASHRVELSAAELRERAQQARARLEAAGEIDCIGDNQGVGADAAPAFDTLVGKTIEVRWRYYAIEDGKRKQVRAHCPHHPVVVCPLVKSA